MIIFNLLYFVLGVALLILLHAFFKVYFVGALKAFATTEVRTILIGLVALSVMAVLLTLLLGRPALDGMDRSGDFHDVLSKGAFFGYCVGLAMISVAFLFMVGMLVAFLRSKPKSLPSP